MLQETSNYTVGEFEQKKKKERVMDLDILTIQTCEFKSQKRIHCLINSSQEEGSMLRLFNPPDKGVEKIQERDT